MFDMRATIIEGYHEVSFQGKLNKVHMTFVFKWGNVWFTTVPLKALSDQLSMLIILKKLIIFNYGFSTKVTCAFLLQENTYEL